MDCPARVIIIVAPVSFAACPCVPAIVPMIAIKTHTFNGMRTAGILYPNRSSCSNGLLLHNVAHLPSPRKLGYDAEAHELHAPIKVENCAGDWREQRDRQADGNCAGGGGLRGGVGGAPRGALGSNRGRGEERGRASARGANRRGRPRRRARAFCKDA